MYSAVHPGDGVALPTTTAPAGVYEVYSCAPIGLDARRLDVRRLVVAALAFAAIVTAALVVAAQPAVVDALKAAGVTGKAPAGASSFTKLINTLDDNLLWVFVTCVGLAITIGGTLFMVGYSRAMDNLVKVGGGIAVILVGVPAVVG